MKTIYPDELVIGDNTSDFYAVVRRRGNSGDDRRWVVYLCRPQTSWPIAVSMSTRDKAAAIASYLLRELEQDHSDEVRDDEARYKKFNQEMKIKNALKAREDAALWRKLLRKINRKTDRIHRSKCPECDYVTDADDFNTPHYECSECGTTGNGDDERRCDQCGKFRSNDSDRSCPSCGEPLEEVIAVVGVEVDRTFIEESALPESKQMQPVPE